MSWGRSPVHAQQHDRAWAGTQRLRQPLGPLDGVVARPGATTPPAGRALGRAAHSAAAVDSTHCASRSAKLLAHGLHLGRAAIHRLQELVLPAVKRAASPSASVCKRA